MAAPAWATNMTTFWLTGATTVTSLGGGPSGLGNPETDFFIEGTDCLSKAAWTNALKGFIVDALGTNFTVPTDGAVILFAKYDAQGSLDTKANGGFRIIIGSGASDYYHYYIGGNDTLAFDSWVPYVVDPNTATSDAQSGTPSGSERQVGILANLPTTSGPTKGNPIAIDAVRYGRCDIEYTDGDLGNGYNTFPGAEAYANATTRRWGLIQLEGGAYQIQGFHSFGTAATAVDFRDANRQLYWRPCGANNLTNDAVSTQFNRIEIINAGSNVEWTNIIITALGTRARGVFVHTAGTLSLDACQFVDMDTFSFLAAASVLDCTFRRCNAVTAPGTDLQGSAFLAASVAADTSALIWNVATGTSGKLNGCRFSKGANAHHAIEFGLSSPTTIDLIDMEFTGFNASDGQQDSALHIKRTSGTVTINLTNTTQPSYKSDGATVVFATAPVTTQITVRNDDGTPLQNARVILQAADGAGDLPYNLSVTNLTRSGSTATATTSAAHGLSTGDFAVIKGANENEYNGCFQVTVTGATTFTYTVVGTPSSPATGTITCTGAYFNSLTNASGIVTDSRSISVDQNMKGYIRKGPPTPIYKDFNLAGTVIDSANGFSLDIRLTPDE